MPLPQNMDLTDLCRFRTKKCQRKSTQGHCELDVRCPFSHCLSWHRRNPIDFSYSQHLCPDVDFRKEGGRMRVRNRCSNGRNCKFSHTKEEQMYHPFVYKTQLCRDHPNCQKAYCPFAHDLDDMRRTQQLEEDMKILRQRKHDTAVQSPSTGVVDLISPNNSAFQAPLTSPGSPKVFPQNPSPRSCSMSTTSSMTHESPNDLSVRSPAILHVPPSWSIFSDENRLFAPLPETVQEETKAESMGASSDGILNDAVPVLYDWLLNYYKQHEGQQGCDEKTLLPLSSESHALLDACVRELKAALPHYDDSAEQ